MSLNEIELLVRRAALGRRLPYGLAEEAGQAAAWLAAAGLDDGRAIKDALARVRPGCAGRGRGCACFTERGEAVSAVLCRGPSMVDRLSLPGVEAVTVRLDVPLVLLGLVGARATELGSAARIGVAIGGGRRVEVRIDCLTLLIRAPAPGVLIAARDVPVVLAQQPGEPDDGATAGSWTVNLDDRRRRALEEGVRLLPDAERALRAHAADSLVPSSEQSRERGAGAGLIDQD